MPGKHPIVVLPDVSLATVRTLLAFIYTGEANVAEDAFAELIEAADILEIRGLGSKADSAEDELDHSTGEVTMSANEVDPLEKISPKKTPTKIEVR